jgi:hypothetical protein
MYFYNVFLIVIILLIQSTVYSQPLPYSVADSLTAVQTILYCTIENSNFFDSAGFIKGFVSPFQGSKIRNPFFQENSWRNGSLNLDGKTYLVDMMKYNIEIDQLIVLISTQSAAYPIEINSKSIKQFHFDAKDFFYLDTILWPGYYEKIPTKKCNIYVKWYKRLLNNQTRGEMYSVHQKVVIEKEGSFYAIHRLTDLYKLFPSIEKELRKYKKQQNIIFNKNPSGAVYQLVELANTIITENEGI